MIGGPRLEVMRRGGLKRSALACGLALAMHPVPAAGTQEASSAEAPATLYRASLLQAAPGRLGDLIEHLRSHFPEDDPASPLILRHSQGDHWDLMILGPAATLDPETGAAAPADLGAVVRGETASPPAAAAGEALEQPIASDVLDALVSWTEDLWAWGPSADIVRERADGAGLFHIEMFVALAGERANLVEQRRMENRYLRSIQRPDNLLWTRHAGAEWDTFTIGFYRDLQHYAEPSPLTQEERDALTVEAGFPGPGQIGVYLRRFLLRHNDTLAVVAR